jgi:hypothetical protein
MKGVFERAHHIYIYIYIYIYKDIVVSLESLEIKITLLEYKQY